MGPKKKKAGGKKKKITVDDDDIRSFNLAQREVLVTLLNRLQDLQEENLELMQDRKGQLEHFEEIKEEYVSRLE